MKMIHIPVPGHEDAGLEGYILDCELSLGQETARPAILICPGGGYVYCSDAEAEPVALRYTSSGFHAFILRYSVGFNAGGTAPIFTITELTRASFFVDPIPQALTLTSIVIGACTTAMTLSLIMKIKEQYGTLDSGEIRRLRG